jgi:hypothetical protein
VGIVARASASITHGAVAFQVVDRVVELLKLHEVEHSLGILRPMLLQQSLELKSLPLK